MSTPSQWLRADPAALARFDPRTKACTMNCGPQSADPRSDVERRFLCTDCVTVTPQMLFERMVFDAAIAVIAGAHVTVSRHLASEWPPGFPRGELLSINARFENRSFDPLKVLAWAQKQTR